MKDKENSREIQFKEELVRKAKNGDTKAFPCYMPAFARKCINSHYI